VRGNCCLPCRYALTWWPRRRAAQVCLSLLGTWHGGDASEKWNPGQSSLFQILLSIQGMILVPVRGCRMISAPASVRGCCMISAPPCVAAA